MIAGDNIINEAFEIIKRWHDIIFPTFFDYEDLLNESGILKIPEQLEVYQNDALHDIIFALCNPNLDIKGRKIKLANATEHTILLGVEIIEFYVNERIAILRSFINKLEKKRKWKKIYIKKRFFKKSILFFNNHLQKIQNNHWKIIKENKSSDFNISKKALEDILRRIGSFEEKLQNPRLHDIFYRESSYWKLIKKITYIILSIPFLEIGIEIFVSIIF